MKKRLIFITLLSIFSLTSYSQILFEKGYYINESNQKIECLIKNIDWANNPTKFDFKLTEQGETQKADIQFVKEFSVSGVFKYIRATVKIDKSSENANNLDRERNPVFEEQQLFLKTLIDGSYTLYVYKETNLNRFFYRANAEDSEIKQLVYKLYMVNGGIATNDHFKQQLYTDFRDQGIAVNNVENLNYTQNDLEDFFIKLNKSNNSNYTISESKEKKILFNLSIKAGINSSSLSIKNNKAPSYYSTDFGNKLIPKFGIEAEFILPFNKNKWSVIIEPSFQYFKEETTREVNSFSGGVTTNANYQSIELPVGIRHYLFLNDTSKLFVNISYYTLFDFNGDSSIKQIKKNDNITIYDLNIQSKPSLALGMGYNYKNKYSVEMRYIGTRNVLNDYSNWDTDYKIISLIFGYKLF